MSLVWNFFTKNDDKASVTCKICKTQLKWTSSSTGSMMNHLKLKHPTKINPDTGGGIQQYCVRKRPLPEAKKKEIDRLLLNLIYKDLCPVKFLKSQALKELFAYLEPDYVIPGRETFVKSMEKLYSDVKLELLQRFQTALSRVSITTDCWMSSNAESYITVTGHFIDKDWKIRSVVLATQYLEDCHTAFNLKEKIHEILEEYELKTCQKTFITVHDNAKNIVTAMQQSEIFENTTIGCAAHTLQLAINNAFNKVKNFEKTIAGAARVVGHFKRSYKATNGLKLKQSEMNLPPHKLIQYCVTRWNSVSDMFSRLLEQRWAVSAVLSDRNYTKLSDARTLELKDEMWRIIEDAVNCLKDLKIATEALSADKQVSLSITAPIIYALVNRHLLIKEEDPVTMKELKTLISSDLKTRYAQLFQDDNNITISDDSLLLASFLDPRHKHMPYVSESAKLKIYAHVRELLDRLEDDSLLLYVERAPSTSKTASFLGNDYYSISSNVCDELDFYKSMPVLCVDGDPVFWWKNNVKSFPKLHKIAVDYLAAPASSVSSERMFSAAGRLISKARTRLSAKHVDQILFLNKNHELIQ